MITQRVKTISYAIREIARIAEEIAKTGKEIHYLNIGDPVLFFDTPQFMSQALADASFKGKNYYVNSLGVLELRQAISEIINHQYRIDISSEDVLVTSGVSEGIFFLIASLIENQNEFLIPGPSYPLYFNYTRFFNGVPVEYELNEKNDWEPNIEDLRKKITNKTKIILICSPNNPTGAMFSEKNIKDIIDIAGEYNIPIISDEIYDQITYEKPFSSPSVISKDVPIIGLNGFSKSHLATGWRLGYLYYHDPEDKLGDLKEGIAKMARARLCATSAAQFAAIDILKKQNNHTAEFVKKLKERRDYSYKRLKQIEGISCVNSNGAFYLFPKIDFKEFHKWKNDKDFVIDLLKSTGICTVYGSGFGEFGKDHLRITYLPDLDTLKIVYNLFENFLK